MVRDALEIADGVQQGVDRAVIVGGEMLGAELDQVGAQHVLVMVDGVLFALDLVGDGIVPLMSGGHDLQQRGAADLGHIAAGEHGAGDSHRRSCQQTIIQQGVLLLFVGGGVGYGHDGQLFQQAVEGQQDGGGDYVKNGMHHGDAESIGRRIKEAETDQRMQAVEAEQEDDGADDVEIEMDEGRAFGVFVRTGRGDQRCNGGADVLAHDDGHGGGVGDSTRAGQRLQDAHRRRGRLQHGSQHSAGNDAQHRVAEAEEEIHEPGLISQGRHGVGHSVHAGHQNGETQQDLAYAALAVLTDHIQPDADEAQDRAPGIGVEHFGDKALALEARQRQQPAGNSGTNVGTHDDADGLVQFHQTGVDEADRHNGGGAAGLNNSGDRYAQQQRPDGAGSHGGEDALQFAAGGLLQRLAHQVHAIQEHSDAAHQGEHIKNGHRITRPFSF